MARTIEFSNDALILHLSGLTSAAALKQRVEIPYSDIMNVSIDDFKLSMFQIRVGTSIADIREGRFLIGDRWCFISYENHKDVVILELNNHQFGKVVFQIEDPLEIKERILEHRTNKTI
ncbi:MULTISPECIES: hypothetical protein [unclassified Paenibacillus]|uniref:hypothetical protein n=1 Tax=unclassified Paenibacillus TaxID=185978 RepID=UPI000709F7D5|nr:MULTISPECIES: hypothetical protein [unclassified Paenibacillus]KQX69030.1 hypothetical protein ASD40_00565 [Paenibacillus sp. Root444D2]KRE51576.1 hypothetical protein ASG85_00065 [Paenibacillus sp. Soil724D2]